MSTPVHGAIAKRFPSPEWATFFEVRDAAGFSARRSADVVAMNTWPSRGKEMPDFDGFGVLAHVAPMPDPCGYCSHPSLDDNVCGICGIKVDGDLAGAHDTEGS